MNKITLFITLVLPISTSACVTSLGRLDKSATVSPNESIFVFGVAPENYRVSFMYGTIEDGRFLPDYSRTAAFYGAAENGFVVGKASAGATLALGNVRAIPLDDKDTIYMGTVDFRPCNGVTETIVFSVPRGKVLYLGDIKFLFAGTELKVKYSQNMNGAKRYINDNFPGLRDRLESFEYQLLPCLLPALR